MNPLSRLGRVPALVLAERAARAPGPIIPMPGAPVIEMPSHVVEAARAAASEVQGRETRGTPALRHALARMLADRQHVTVNPDDELLVTHGASQALSVALGALLEPGDEVVVPVPSYFFDGPIVRAGGTPVHVVCDAAKAWAWDLDRIEGAITKQTRAILVCNPVNPTGRLHTSSEIDELVCLARERGVFLIADESFSDYVFDGVHTPLATRRGSYEHIVSIQSLSKNYAFQSWRIGYVQAEREVLASIHACFEWDAINVGPVPQAAATAALTGERTWLDAVIGQYGHKRDLMIDAVRGAGLAAVVPAAGAAVFADLSPLGLAGRELEDALIRQGVAAMAGDSFGGPAGHVRLLFGGADQHIHDVGAALGRATSGRPANSAGVIDHEGR